MNHIREGLDKKKLVTLVSLEMEGAFDSACWPQIRIRQAEEDCPGNIQKILGNYLQNRTVKVRYAGE